MAKWWSRNGSGARQRLESFASVTVHCGVFGGSLNFLNIGWLADALKRCTSL